MKRRVLSRVSLVLGLILPLPVGAQSGTPSAYTYEDLRDESAQALAVSGTIFAGTILALRLTRDAPVPRAGIVVDHSRTLVTSEILGEVAATRENMIAVETGIEAAERQRLILAQRELEANLRQAANSRVAALVGGTAVIDSRLSTAVRNGRDENLELLRIAYRHALEHGELSLEGRARAAFFPERQRELDLRELARDPERIAREVEEIMARNAITTVTIDHGWLSRLTGAAVRRSGVRILLLLGATAPVIVPAANAISFTGHELSGRDLSQAVVCVLPGEGAAEQSRRHAYVGCVRASLLRQILTGQTQQRR